jgi:anti-sigma B factor antagonist
MIDVMATSHGSLRAQQMVKLGRLRMTSEREGDVHTIGLSGELDLATADGVQRELECVEATDVEAIVVDLSGLTFMDSSGVRLIVRADARSRADSNRLTLLRGPSSVQRVFALSGLEDRLPFAD